MDAAGHAPAKGPVYFFVLTPEGCRQSMANGCDGAWRIAIRTGEGGLDEARGGRGYQCPPTPRSSTIADHVGHWARATQVGSMAVGREERRRAQTLSTFERSRRRGKRPSSVSQRSPSRLRCLCFFPWTIYTPHHPSMSEGKGRFRSCKQCRAPAPLPRSVVASRVRGGTSLLAFWGRVALL